MQHPRPNPLAAAAFVLIAGAFVAGTMLMAKLVGSGSLGAPLHPFMLSFARFLFAFLIISFACLIFPIGFSKVHWRLHCLRSFFGWGSATLLFAAAFFIPLSDASAISFTNPVIALGLAALLLHEKIGRWRIGAAGAGLIGALILTRPSPDSFQSAALLAFGAAFCMGCEVIAIKLLSGKESPLQVLLINNLIGMCLAGGAALTVWQQPTFAQWAALAAIGLLMVCAQALFIQALRRADASFVSPFWYATLAFAGLYDFIAFDVAPDGISIFGAVIILSSGAILAWRESRRPIKPV